jgi:hypothetical protein
MPPRYAYWTIIVDGQPTAFRSGTQEELMPTFKRLKAKNDSAVMMWWQHGKLWPSRVDAEEMMRARGEMGRRGDDRQAGAGFRDRDRKPTRERSAWTPRGEPSTPAPARNADAKLDWKPKGEFVPAPKRADRTGWKPKHSFEDPKPAWKPKGSSDRDQKGAWSPKSPRPEKPEWKPKGTFDRDRKPSSRGSFDRDDRPRSFTRPDFKSSGDDSRAAKPEWKPKGSFVPAPPRAEKPEWGSKGSFDRERKSEWKPKPSFVREGRPDWKAKPASRDGNPAHAERPQWKAKGSFDRERKPASTPNRDSGGRFSSPDSGQVARKEKLDWKPKGEGARTSQPRDFVPAGEKRKWVPKEEYKKSMGIEAKRDSKWRPGGEHKDPRQKYKDAKKAKWTKFKQNIRARSGGKGKKSS